MKAVVDASVAAKWVIEEDDTEQAVSLLAYELYAPDHWIAEAVNVVWSKVYKGELQAEDAKGRVAALMRAPVIATPIATVMHDAFGIAVEHAVTVYDALYLALARWHKIPFVTGDRKLIQRLRGTPLSSLVMALQDLAVG